MLLPFSLLINGPGRSLARTRTQLRWQLGRVRDLVQQQQCLEQLSLSLASSLVFFLSSHSPSPFLLSLQRPTLTTRRISGLQLGQSLCSRGRSSGFNGKTLSDKPFFDLRHVDVKDLSKEASRRDILKLQADFDGGFEGREDGRFLTPVFYQNLAYVDQQWMAEMGYSGRLRS